MKSRNFYSLEVVNILEKKFKFAHVYLRFEKEYKNTIHIFSRKLYFDKAPNIWLRFHIILQKTVLKDVEADGNGIIVNQMENVI